MKKLSLSIIILLVIAMLAGCAVRNQKDIQKNESPTNAEQKTDPVADPVIQPEIQTHTIVLYFGDTQAMGFNKEERIIDKFTPERLIEELISGPEYEHNIQTIPDHTILIDINVENKIAYVNFSKELVENHWGGSAGEAMTLGSIVNTLVLNEGTEIEKVQILIEGKIVETLAGHIDISLPLEPTID